MTLQLPGYSHFTNNPVYRAATSHLVAPRQGALTGESSLTWRVVRAPAVCAYWSNTSSAELILVDPDKDALVHAQELCSIPSRAFCTFAEQLPSCNTRECGGHRYSRQRTTPVQRH